MKNALKKGIKIAGVLLLAITINFTFVTSSLNTVRPLVVNAEDSAGAQLKKWWYELLALGSAYGVTMGVVWTQDTISKIIDLYTSKNTIQSMSDDDAKVKVVGNDAVFSNTMSKVAYNFWDWLKTTCIDPTVGVWTNVSIPGSADFPTGGTYTTVSSLNLWTHWYSTKYYEEWTFSVPVKALVLKVADASLSTSNFAVIRAFSDVPFSFTQRYQTNGAGDFKSSSGNITATYSGKYYCSITDVIGVPDGFPQNVYPNLNTADYSADNTITAYSYVYGSKAVAPTTKPISIDVDYDDEANKRYADINDSAYGVVVPNIATNVDRSAIASDGTVTADVINTSIEKKVSDDAIATPINPAVPATYPLSDTADIAKPVDPSIYNPPSSIASSSYGVVGLQDVFPFCIPFDMVNFVSALKADPVAPVVTFPLHFVGVLDYDFTIDLNQWNSVAVVFRGCELALSVMGLFFITRWMLGDK